MGIKEWLANTPKATFIAKEFIALHDDRIEKGQGKGKETHPLTDVSARGEDGAALETRVTATRLVAFGVFAFAAKKKKGGESFLTIEGPDFMWAVEVDRKRKNEAMRFAATVSNFARKAGA